jgi:hypothetical protein
MWGKDLNPSLSLSIKSIRMKRMEKETIDRVVNRIENIPLIRKIKTAPVHLSPIPISSNGKDETLVGWLFVDHLDISDSELRSLVVSILSAIQATINTECATADFSIGILRPGSPAQRLIRIAVKINSIDVAINSFRNDLSAVSSGHYFCTDYRKLS